MSADAGGPSPATGPRPELPPRPAVPDDRIHGDSLPQAGDGGRESSRWPPAPTPPPRPRPRRRGFRSHGRGRRWAVVGAVAGLAVIGMNVGRSAGSVEQHATLNHAVTGIRINSDSGDVRVSGGAAPGTVELTRRVPRNTDTADLAKTQTWQGKTLMLQSEGCGPMMFGCSTDYTLRVPDGTSVVIDDGSGDLRLDGSLGVVELKTGSGDIDVKNLRTQALDVRTGSGDLDLSFATAPDALNLKSGSGDVNVKVPADDTYAVDVTTGSGDAEIKVKTDSASAHKIAVNTGSGDISIDKD